VREVTRGGRERRRGRERGRGAAGGGSAVELRAAEADGTLPELVLHLEARRRGTLELVAEEVSRGAGRRSAAWGRGDRVRLRRLEAGELRGHLREAALRRARVRE